MHDHLGPRKGAVWHVALCPGCGPRSSVAGQQHPRVVFCSTLALAPSSTAAPQWSPDVVKPSPGPGSFLVENHCSERIEIALEGNINRRYLKFVFRRLCFNVSNHKNLIVLVLNLSFVQGPCALDFCNINLWSSLGPASLPHTHTRSSFSRFFCHMSVYETLVLIKNKAFKTNTFSSFIYGNHFCPKILPGCEFLQHRY